MVLFGHRDVPMTSARFQQEVEEPASPPGALGMRAVHPTLLPLFHAVAPQRFSTRLLSLCRRAFYRPRHLLVLFAHNIQPRLPRDEPLLLSGLDRPLPQLAIHRGPFEERRGIALLGGRRLGWRTLQRLLRRALHRGLHQAHLDENPL